MFADMQSEYGVTAPKAAGALPPEKVGDAVVKAIEKDLFEVDVTRGPIRILVAFSILAPRAFERIMRRLDLAAPFRNIAERRSAAKLPGT